MNTTYDISFLGAYGLPVNNQKRHSILTVLILEQKKEAQIVKERQNLILPSMETFIWLKF